MKVYISKYRNHWLSPYVILEKVFFWREIDYEEPIIEKWADRLEPFSKVLQDVLDFIHPRIEYVKIDHWDTWSMDHTLSSIVVPMLKQLKEVKHGAPNVDDEDVPEELKSTSAPPKEEYDVDDNHFKRWDYVMDEMIFAHQSKLDDDWQEQFYIGVADYIHVEVPSEKYGKLYQMKEGPNHTQKVDWDGMKAYEARIQNGFRLFGKYYQGLWD
jgi:hypothetical protein